MSGEESNSGGSSEVLVGLITAPPTDAGRIAGEILDRGLAACCSIVPAVTSIFNWEGARQVETESLIIVKTSRSCAAKLPAAVKEIHPYDVPEVVLLGACGGLAEYLNWVIGECDRTGNRG
jgi:periplasmic divalent cation tolerance protein